MFLVLDQKHILNGGEQLSFLVQISLKYKYNKKKISGSLIGVGYNNDGRIKNSLTKTVTSQFSEISMNDSSSRQLAPVSAVCTIGDTLYMFTKSCGTWRQLFYLN